MMEDVKQQRFDQFGTRLQMSSSEETLLVSQGRIRPTSQELLSDSPGCLA